MSVDTITTVSTHVTSMVSLPTSSTPTSDPPSNGVWEQILKILEANTEVWIKSGIGIGGFLLGIILTILIFRCKRKGDTKEVMNTTSNGKVTNGRTPEEMDDIIRHYISGANTIKKQWGDTEDHHISQPVDDVIGVSRNPDAHVAGQNQYIDPVYPGPDVPNSEYTNSGLVQDYRGDEGEHLVGDPGLGENYFYLQKDFVEVNGHDVGVTYGAENGEQYSGLMHDQYQYDPQDVGTQGVHPDNYFLLQKDFIPGLDIDSQDQSQVTVL